MDETLKDGGEERRGRRSTTSSPEFEFWVTRDPDPDDLLSADELFVDGVLLPLHLLNRPPPSSSSATRPDQDHPVRPAETSSSSILSTPTGGLTASKRWKDILFKKPTVPADDTEKKKKKKKTRKKDGFNSGSGSGSAELNINIWPFSRSRSAGNGGNRPKLVPPRKVSSAPCSRSNSSGESKSRKWPSSPGRVGVHLGRSSPVWQVRRSGSRGTSGLGGNKEVTEARRGKSSFTEDGDSSEGRAKVLSLNVPKCIGYRQHLGVCRADDGGGSAGNRSAGAGGGNFFNLRSLFGKKVY